MENNDIQDKKESRLILISITFLVIICITGIVLLAPEMSEIINTSFSPGLGFKEAAIISFFITIVIMVIFAIVSGDGIIGEIQFLLASFFIFFIIIWLMLAWIF